MAKLKLNKQGFLLVETCIVVMILMGMIMLFLPCIQLEDMDDYGFVDTYLQKKTDALFYGHKVYLDDLEVDITFNENGNVNHAMTIEKGKHVYIIELGGGTLVEQ